MSGKRRIPEDKDQCIVKTPYGAGLVIRTRKDEKGNVSMREIELTNWKTTTKNSSVRPSKRAPAMLYSKTDFPSVDPKVGDDVLCSPYGRGRVVEIRRDKNSKGGNNSDSSSSVVGVVVRLSSWRLANRSLVTCYINHQVTPVKVVAFKNVYDMSAYERIDYGQERKKKASKMFVAKDYKGALDEYATAIDAVRYMQHNRNSTNQIRGDLLVLMITCSNNAAKCCLQLSKWDNAANFAKSSSALIDALAAKREKSQILQSLIRDGTKEITILGTWRVKSEYFMARACAEKKRYTDALDALKRANDIIVPFSKKKNNKNDKDADKQELRQLLSLQKDVKKLHVLCKERKKAILEKEKQRAKAMFATKPSSSSASTTIRKNVTITDAVKKEEKLPASASSSVQADLVDFLNSKENKYTKTNTNKASNIPNATTISKHDDESNKNHQLFDDKLTPKMKDRIQEDIKDESESNDEENYDEQGLEPTELMFLTLGLTAISFVAYQFFRRRTA